MRGGGLKTDENSKRFDWAEDIASASPIPLGPFNTFCTVSPLMHVNVAPVKTTLIKLNAITTPLTLTSTTTITFDDKAPIIIVAPLAHMARNLSALHLGAQNPWASLHRCHCYSQKPQQPMHRKHHSFTYPTKIPVHMPVKPNPPPSTCVFETITHPYGIGPTKPVIRVPAQTAMDAPANLMLHTYQAIVKSSPPLHSSATI